MPRNTNAELDALAASSDTYVLIETTVNLAGRTEVTRANSAVKHWAARSGRRSNCTREQYTPGLIGPIDVAQFHQEDGFVAVGRVRMPSCIGWQPMR